MTKNDPAPRPSRVRAQYAQGVDLRPGIFETMLSGKKLHAAQKNRLGPQRYDEKRNLQGGAPNYLSIIELMILPQATPSRRAEKREGVVKVSTPITWMDLGGMPSRSSSQRLAFHRSM